MTVLKFVTRTVFIATLGKSYLGINGLFSDILTMLSLTELGVDTAINFQLYKPLAEHDEKRVRVLMKFYKQAYRIIGTTILVLGLCLIPALPVLIRDYDSLEPLGINATLIFLLYLLQSVSSYLFFAYRSAILKADQKMYVLDVAGYGITIATNITQILILVFLGDFVIYTACVIAFNLLRNFVYATIATRRYPYCFKREDDSLSKGEVLGLLKDCGALFLFKVNNVVLKATDNLVLSMFSGLGIVGLYSNYLLFYTTIRSLLNQLYNAVKASMGNLFAVGDVARRYEFFQVMNFLTVFLCGTAGVVVAVCADELISTWVGSDYVVAQPLAALIGLEILFYGLKLNLNQIRNVSGAFRQVWYRPVISAIVNLSVSVALVQVIGIYGVLCGTILADIFANFLVDPSVIHRYSFENYRPVSEYYIKNLGYLCVLLGCVFIDGMVCRLLFMGHGWLSVAFHAFIVVLTVPSALAIVYHRTREFKYLIGFARGTIKKIVSNLRKH